MLFGYSYHPPGLIALGLNELSQIATIVNMIPAPVYHDIGADTWFAYVIISTSALLTYVQ